MRTGSLEANGHMSVQVVLSRDTGIVVYRSKSMFAFSIVMVVKDFRFVATFEGLSGAISELQLRWLP